MTGAQRVGQRSVRMLLLAAPLIFVAHFLEEGPRFVPWFNAHVSRDITEPLFWNVNFTGLAITLAVVTFEWLSASEFSAALVVAWLALLMLANGVFHVVGAIVDGAYVPGLVTAVVLYLPFFTWVAARVIQSGRLSRGAVIAAAMIGSAPMAVHGYLILFRGSRLF